MMSPVIEIQSLTKRFGNLVAVDDISLKVEAGQIFAILGHNGAGKTTMIKMICSLIRPTSGDIWLNGHHVLKRRSKAMQQIGAVLEGTRNIYWRLSAWDNLLYFGQLKGVAGKELRHRAKTLLTILDLWDRRHDAAGDFSRGMQQKLAIASALIGDPPILLLDEPTLGLDVQAARTLREQIVQLATERGKTIIITSHQLAMVQAICDRVAVIKQGKLIANQAIDDLLSGHVQEHYVVKVEGCIDPQWVPLPSSLDIQTQNGSTLISGFGADSASLHQILQAVHAMNLPVQSVQRIQPSLEEIFVQLTNR